MEQYEKLFESVSQLLNKVEVAKEESRLRGERFNIFKVCGIDHYELQHSSIIAEMIDPKGSHGQGCLYLNLFMETYGSKLCFGNLKPEDISVKKEERSYGENGEYNGRMDIYVDYKGIPLLIIENKLYAKDQSIQLKKYDREAIHRNAKEGEYEIVYLTLDGKDASNDSGAGVHYIKMSYSKDIVKWLDLCIEKSSRIPIVRETLVQYQNHVKQLTHQDMEKKDKEKMFELMSNYPEAIAEIIHNKWQYIEYVYKERVQKEFLAFANNHNLLYKENNLWGDGCGGFFFHKLEWKHYAVIIWRDTWSSGFYIGVSWYGDRPQDKDILENNKLSCLTNNAIDYWPYGYAYLDKYRYWDEYTAVDMINGEFTRAITDYVVKIINEIEDKGLQMS